MDDAEEVKTRNSEFLGKYCFVSSWTDIEEESIPFWGLYTKNMSGVRIKLRKCPFKTKTYSLPWFDNGKEFESYIPEKLMLRDDIYVYPTLPFLRKVEYTKDNNLIFPEPINYLIKKPNGKYDVKGNFNDINKYKRDSWQFQSEWRYSFFVIPHDEQGHIKMQLDANTSNLPFQYYDMQIDDDAFDNIEILIGPKMNPGDRELLKLLCEKYCPNAIIKESMLLINQKSLQIINPIICHLD